MSDSLQLPEGFSLDKRFMEERWLLELGTFPAVTLDTLLGYAYMQPSVAAANLVIDMDESNEGRNPKVTVQIEIRAKRRYRLATWGLRRGGILGKLVALAAAIAGAPLAVAGAVETLVSNYLPGKYSVTVQVFSSPLKNVTPAPGLRPVVLK